MSLTRPAISNSILTSSETAVGRMEREEEEYTYSDSELSTLIKTEVQSSQQDWQTRVALQRERSYRYYYGQEFGNERPGFSRHVSMEVFDSVEGIKSELMAAFTSGPQVVKFEEEMGGDAPAADAATKYVHGIFYTQNDGYNILKDAIHDALVAKQCCIRRSFRTTTRVQPESFQGIPVAQLNVIAEDPNVREIIVDKVDQQTVPQQTPQGVIPFPVEVASGQVIKQSDVSDVCVEVIAPEDVFITVQADDAMKADTVVLRFERTQGELIAEGYDEELVEKIGWSSFSWDYQAYGRHSIDDTYDWDHRQGERERTVVEVFEAYILLDMDGDGIPEPWKITVGGDVLLDKEQVTEFPLHFWSPYRIAHKAIGMSVADVTMDIQRTSSGFVRGVIDNVFLTNTATKIADLELIRNPRDLIDNPIGAVINSPDMDAVRFVPQPQLNPATFQGFDLIKAQKEERTGLSRLQQGQNMKVLDHQNSSDLVDTMMQAGGGRITEMARSFGEFLKPIFAGIYKIGVENQQVVGVPSADGFRVLDPSDWKPVRNNMTVHVALTPGDRAKHAGFLAGAYQMLSQDQQLKPLFGVKQKFAIIAEIFSLQGIANPTYLLNPESPEGQQALQQAAQQTQQMQQKQEQMAQAGLQMQQKKDDDDTRLKSEKQMADAMADGAEQALDEDEFEWRKHVDAEELALEKKLGGKDVGRKTQIGAV